MKKSKLKKVTDSRTYKILSIICGDPYPDEGINFYPKYRRGFKNPNKTIERYKMRMYKTWKHNRITKWK